MYSQTWGALDHALSAPSVWGYNYYVYCALAAYRDVYCALPSVQYGLTRMLQSEQGLIIFVSAMDPYNENMMADVLRVAAAVCLVADG